MASKFYQKPLLHPEMDQMQRSCGPASILPDREARPHLIYPCDMHAVRSSNGNLFKGPIPIPLDEY
jgi:hypothetical protein